MIFATLLFLHFTPLAIAFLTLFLKILGLQGKVPCKPKAVLKYFQGQIYL